MPSHAGRFILVDSYARYAAAFGEAALGAGDRVPEALRAPALTRAAARREVLARWVALAGPVTVEDAVARYGFAARTVERRFEEWERGGMLVRGAFGGDRTVSRWCSRRLLEQARRRELAQARKQIAAVELADFARFLQRWQHVAPEARVRGEAGTALVIEQLQGLARPAAAWERDYLPARVDGYDRESLGRLAASGRLVWVVDAKLRARFVERGTGRLWLEPPADVATLSDAAQRVHEALRAQGASFTLDLAVATGLGPQRVRDALRELVTAGLVTNDTVEALRDVMRWKPIFAPRRDEPDPTRWLPADFQRQRPIVQRRVNPRSLARWKRPDRPEAVGWGGRWSLVHTPGVLGIAGEPAEEAEEIARQWLARYGVVSRDWWRRERPAIGWREIYHELKRLEFRGEVRRGYFVGGLAGAQFALPEAVEMLRAADATTTPEPVVLAASDPSNPYGLPLADGTATDPLARPRGAGALLVTVDGRVVLAAEGRGKRLRVREGIAADVLRSAIAALVARLGRADGGKRHDVVVETVDGESAATSGHAEALREAGFRSMGSAMRFYVALR